MQEKTASAIRKIANRIAKECLKKVAAGSDDAGVRRTTRSIKAPISQKNVKKTASHASYALPAGLGIGALAGSGIGALLVDASPELQKAKDKASKKAAAALLGALLGGGLGLHAGVKYVKDINQMPS